MYRVAVEGHCDYCSGAATSEEGRQKAFQRRDKTIGEKSASRNWWQTIMRIPCRCSYVNLSDAGDPDDQRESRERNSMLVAGNCSKDDAEGGCVCVVDSILAAQEAEPRATERERPDDHPAQPYCRAWHLDCRWTNTLINNLQSIISIHPLPNIGEYCITHCIVYS